MGSEVLPQKLNAREEPATPGEVDFSHGQLARTDDRGCVQGVSIEALQHARLVFWANTTDEVQPVDAGVGRMLKVEVGRQLDIWLAQSDNLDKWENNALTASDRRVLITPWVGAAMEIADNRPGCRFRLFKTCGMAMAVDGSGDD